MAKSSEDIDRERNSDIQIKYPLPVMSSSHPCAASGHLCETYAVTHWCFVTGSPRGNRIETQSKTQENKKLRRTELPVKNQSSSSGRFAVLSPIWPDPSVCVCVLWLGR